MLDEVYTADAQILPPGAPKISGRDAIKQFWTDLVSSANAKSVTLASDDVINAGDGVVEIGHATQVLEAAEISAKYVVYWRQEQGRWKWHVDIWNANS
jgi:ketosteroid isomerase-like protein